MTEKKPGPHADVHAQSSSEPSLTPEHEEVSPTKENSAQGSKQWYVLQVRSGYERKVLDALNERIKQNNLTEKFGQIIVPTEEVVEIRQGRMFWLKWIWVRTVGTSFKKHLA